MIQHMRESKRTRLLSRCAAAAVGLALFHLSFPAMAEVRILDVAGVSAPEWQGFAPLYLKKFQTFAEATGSRDVRIRWETDEELPAGTLVIFEYRTRGQRDKVVYAKLGRLTPGSHETKLGFSENDIIASWRVRIATGAVTRATRANPEWR